MAGNVAVVPLVVALEAQEVSRGTGSGGRSFAGPVQRRGVVGAAEDSALADIKILDSAFMLEKVAGELKVRIGDRSLGICERDELGDGLFQEIHAPDERRRRRRGGASSGAAGAGRDVVVGKPDAAGLKA